MFDLSTVMMLAAVACIAGLFWQFRQLGEQAQRYAIHYCKQNQLQYLDIALYQMRLRLGRRGPYWHSRYRFGFSSDHESRYEGELQFSNRRLLKIEMPVYRTIAAEGEHLE